MNTDGQKNRYPSKEERMKQMNRTENIPVTPPVKNKQERKTDPVVESELPAWLHEYYGVSRI